MIAISIPLLIVPEIKESQRHIKAECCFYLSNDLMSKIPHHTLIFSFLLALWVVDFILGRQEMDSYVSWLVSTGNSDADESRQAGSVQWFIYKRSIKQAWVNTRKAVQTNKQKQIQRSKAGSAGDEQASGQNPGKSRTGKRGKKKQ